MKDGGREVGISRDEGRREVIKSKTLNREGAFVSITSHRQQ